MKTGNVIVRRMGFTVTEVVLATGILSIVMAGVIGLYFTSRKTWHATSLDMDTSNEASFALQKMIYGVGTNVGLRAAYANTVNVVSNGSNWTLSYSTPAGPTNYYSYDSAQDCIRYSNNVSTGSVATVGEQISAAYARKDADGIYVVVTATGSRARQTSESSKETYVKFRN